MICRLGRCLCNVRAGQYWRIENLKSFDEFLERRFPGSRRQAYYLMSIHEHLPPEVKRELKQAGLSKGLELADFLAGANLNHGDPDILLRALARSFHFLPAYQQQAFLQSICEQIQ